MKYILGIDADFIIYPVGSAHIHGENSSEKRLAALLAKNVNIELELVNLYAKNNNFAYETVQQDIENFKKIDHITYFNDNFVNSIYTPNESKESGIGYDKLLSSDE